MKFNKAAVAASAAFFSSIAHAEDASEPAAAPQLPTFTPTNLKAPFIEQFTSGWEKRWKPSHAKKDMQGSSTEEEEWAYVGEWSVEEPRVFKGMEGDKGLVLKNPAAHHAISAKFDKVDNTKKTLVVQYEVKLQDGLECGGAYMKLVRNNALNQDEFGNATPYVIMFGPDKCGHTNKVHFIFNHKNPTTGEYEEKHLTSPPSAKIVKTTELYTLIVNSSDNTYAIKVNNEEVKSGSLFEDFSPPVNPEKEIDDPKDSKPETWVDQARIPDPAASKPEDWDEDAPFEIVDESAEMPEDWLENEPLTIPDPEAEKPADWDDEEDGDWVAPTIPNPKCDDASGCGPWTKPMTKNPDYKGKWTAPYIDNPDYKGVWAPRKIKNPDFYEDKHPAHFEPIGGIGFELWTMQADILFDNIYIGHSVADAEKFAEQTFLVKHPIEKALGDAEAIKQKPDIPKSPMDLKFLDDPVFYIKEKLDLFLTIAQTSPIEAVKFVPEIAAGFVAIFVSLVAIILGVIGVGSSPAVQQAAVDAKDKTKQKAKEVTEKAAQATSTGAEKAKAEVNKRTTRAQS